MVVLSHIKRGANPQKVSLRVAGLPDGASDSVMLFWVTPAGVLISEAVTGNGVHVLTADFDAGFAYTFMGISFLSPAPVPSPCFIVEDQDAVLVAPILSQVDSVGSGAVNVRYTQPADRRVASHLVRLRNMTRGARAWTSVAVAGSPAAISGLTLGCVYRFTVQAVDSQGRTSAPSAVVEHFVRS